MKEGLTGHLIIRNGEKYDYNYREAVASIIDVVDEFVLLEAYSEDDTFEHCLTLKEKYHPKLRIIRGEWESEQDPVGHEYLRLSRLTNQCIDECNTKFSFQIQADEAYHEDGMEAIRHIVEGKTRWGNKVMACMFPYIHLVGNPQTRFPFVYDAAIRLARTDSSWRSDGDGWRMHPSDPADSFVVHMEHPVCFHYGKIGHSMKKLLKQENFQMSFTALGFPDPKIQEMIDMGEGMSYKYLFQDALEKGLFTPFTGTHPKVMSDWLESHEQYWETFTE